MTYTIGKSVSGDFARVVETTIDALDSIATEVRDRFDRIITAVGEEFEIPAEA